MKCISKKIVISIILCITLVLGFCGCSKEVATYDVYESSYAYGITNHDVQATGNFFATDFCVKDEQDLGSDELDSHYAYGAGVFNNTKKEVMYAQRIHDRMYPASTTKIVTALVALKYGNLDDIYTVSEFATVQEYKSSVAHLQEGDRLTLRQLLYGLMLPSGNDAAIVIAEGLCGSVEAFVDLMNKESYAMGATNTHFVTCNGLHDDNHYTTTYDMYLIFSQALENPHFKKLISTPYYTTTVTDASGNPREMQWATTNQYLKGMRKIPEGFTIIGGKTGTTGQAAYCLVLLSQNEKGDDIVSIVYHADCRYNLYYFMSQILSQFGNQ